MFNQSCWRESEASAALRRLTAFAWLIALCGCAGSLERSPPELVYDPGLVSGERLFDEPVDLDRVPDVGVVASDAAMRAWVAAQIASVRRPVARMRQLIQGLQNDGYFATRDHTDETLTAAEAFRTRSGNCLSYTNLFVALAREAGLDAVYHSP